MQNHLNDVLLWVAVCILTALLVVYFDSTDFMLSVKNSVYSRGKYVDNKVDISAEQLASDRRYGRNVRRAVENGRKREERAQSKRIWIIKEI